MGAAETAGFMEAVADCAPVGYSLYAFPGTRPLIWSALTAAPPAGARPCT
jgi:hypothetical protein